MKTALRMKANSLKDKILYFSVLTRRDYNCLNPDMMELCRPKKNSTKIGR